MQSRADSGNLPSSQRVIALHSKTFRIAIIFLQRGLWMKCKDVYNMPLRFILSCIYIAYCTWYLNCSSQLGIYRIFINSARSSFSFFTPSFPSSCQFRSLKGGGGGGGGFSPDFCKNTILRYELAMMARTCTNNLRVVFSPYVQHCLWGLGAKMGPKNQYTKQGDRA